MSFLGIGGNVNKLLALSCNFPTLALPFLCCSHSRRISFTKMSGVAQSSSARLKYVEGGEIAPISASDGFTFRVVSYNILAQVYVKSSIFPHSPSPCLKWKARSQEILKELKALDADFFCIQELDEYDSFYKGQMEGRGYSSLYIKRNGRKRDGCGTFYKNSCAELIMKEEVEYNDLTKYVENKTVSFGNNSYVSLNMKGVADKPCEDLPENDDGDDKGDPNDPYIRLKRDNVAIMAAFRLQDPLQHVVIIANTHLYWDPDWADVKLAQAKYLKLRLGQFKALVSDKFKCRPSVIVTGDFNSTPGDEVYQFLVDGSLVNDALCSLYSYVGGEPAFTTHTPGFTGTLDYIFFSASGKLKPIGFLELPGRDSPDIIGGLPNFHHPSDHLPMAAEFRLSVN